MGRIKTQQVKRLTMDVVKAHLEKFKPTFEENKAIVDTVLDGASKKVRNVVAGYVTRLMKHKENLQ